SFLCIEPPPEIGITHRRDSRKCQKSACFKVCGADNRKPSSGSAYPLDMYFLTDTQLGLTFRPSRPSNCNTRTRKPRSLFLVSVLARFCCVVTFLSISGITTPSSMHTC